MSNGTTSGDILSFGLKGSGFADSTLITGFISAFRQFGREMVSTEGQISTSIWENQSDGSRRLTLHTTWGRDISEGQDIPVNLQLPVISTLCQLGGPPLNERDYDAVESFVRRLNDEILFRMITFEIPINQVVTPWTAINLLENVLQDIPKKEIMRFLRRSEKSIDITFDQILNQDLHTILAENPKLLKFLLNQVSLQSSCNQELYESKIRELHNYLDGQRQDFLKWDAILQKSREFIRNEQKVLDKIKKEYQGFSDKFLTFYENKNAIFWALEKLIQVFNELRVLLKPINNSPPVQDIFKIVDNFPKMEKFDEYISKISPNDVSFLQILNVLNPDTTSKILKLLTNKVPESLSRGDSLLKQLQEHLHAFSDLLAKTNRLSQELSKKRPVLQELYKQIIGGRTHVEEQNKQVSKNIDTTGGVLLQDVKSSVILPKCDLETISCAQQNLKTNLLHFLIDILYTRSLQDYLNFKYALCFNGSIRDAYFSKVLQRAGELEHEIQDFSFAALLNRFLLQIRNNNLSELNPLKKQAIMLLVSFLKFFLKENLKQDPFLKKQENPVIAIDSYSREFCTNLILRAGLGEDILNVAGDVLKIEEYKNEFIQILENNSTSALKLPRSPVEAKQRYRTLLTKALLKTYASFFEDYFCRILPLEAELRDPKQIYVLGKLWKFIPGNYVQKQYSIITTEIKCYFGIKNLFHFINALNHKNFKVNTIDFRYLLNYLAIYFEESSKSPRELMCAFSDIQGFQDFFQFTNQKFDVQTKSLSSQLKQTYEKTIKFVDGVSQNKPRIVFEMRLLNSDFIQTLTGILDNYIPEDRELFRDGINAPRGHPSKNFNLQKLETQHQEFIEKLPTLRLSYSQEIKELNKLLHVVTLKLPSYLDYSSKVCAFIEGNLSSLKIPEGLDFQQILQIQTGALLDPVRYILPDEITQKLTIEQHLTESNIVNLTKVSKEVQTILQKSVIEALEKSGLFRDFLDMKPRISLDENYYLELAFNVPDTIEPEACRKIFTQDLFASENTSSKTKDISNHILGLKLPTKMLIEEGRSLLNLLNERVSQEISVEIEPIYALIDQYAQEAHSGFKGVFESYFGQISKKE